MKKYIFSIWLLLFSAGMGAIPLYQYLATPAVTPSEAFTPGTKPALVSAEEIAAAVRADAFLVSSRSQASAKVQLKSGVDISSDAPTDGFWSWLGHWWNYHHTRDRLTAEVSGDVLAGFDLKQITAANVVTSTNDEVVFNLGTPEFMGVLNDEMATKIIRRETGWFRLKDETLLLAVQALGEPALQSTACRDGALTTAGESGKKTLGRITNLLRAQGDNRTVKVVYVPGRC